MSADSDYPELQGYELGKTEEELREESDIYYSNIERIMYVLRAHLNELENQNQQYIECMRLIKFFRKNFTEIDKDERIKLAILQMLDNLARYRRKLDLDTTERFETARFFLTEIIRGCCIALSDKIKNKVEASKQVLEFFMKSINKQYNFS